MKMKKQVVAIVLLLVAVAAAGTPTPPPMQIVAGTNTGSTAVVKIAVPEFQAVGTDAKTAQLVAMFNRVLWDDLDYSGALALVSKSLYPPGKFSGPADVRPEEWNTAAVGADFIAFGNFRINGNNLSVEGRLWDLKAAQNREMLGRRFNLEDASEDGARQIAHSVADAIVDLIGGAKGIARTSLAYVCERSTGVKELCMMDYDGGSQETLTAHKSIVMSPAWSPDGEKIAFASYRHGTPDLEVISRTDRRLYAFDRVGGTTSQPAWSPDGSRIAFATSRDGSDMEIYVADWNGKNLKRLTVNKSIDVSPVWNPKTGLEMAFTSNRSGTPQIYLMDADGTNVRRLIEEGGETGTAAWSPDGQRIAFAWRRTRGGNFDIYIHEILTGKNVQITNNAGENEKPSWAPDGRHLAFQSSRRGGNQIFSMVLDGSKVRQLTNSGRNTAPAWSGFQ